MGVAGMVLEARGTAAPHPVDHPLPHGRSTVRALLLASPAYQELPPDKRRDLASAMVRVCHAAASLAREEVESRHAAQNAAPSVPPVAAAQAMTASPAPRPLAMAQNAGS